MEKARSDKTLKLGVENLDWPPHPTSLSDLRNVLLEE